jgi:thiazole tautomerase (transcriptional regulator TenI)
MTKLELHVISHEDQTATDLIRCWGPIASWVDAFHVRYKHRSVEQIDEIVQHLQESGAVPSFKLMINQYFSLATSRNCGGIHLPEHVSIDEEWQSSIQRQMRIGRSVHSLDGAKKAEDEGVDYIMVGHIFPSPSKPDHLPLGLPSLRQIVKSIPLPVIAVGGIDTDRINQVMSTGCAGIAVISAVSRHHSPLQVVQKLKEKGNY